MDEATSRIRHVVGCMTGTSLDGLDVVLTTITGTGLDMTAEFVGMVSAPLPDSLRTTLMSMANGEPHPPIEYMRTARHLGVVHAEAVAELISTHDQAAETSGGVDFVVAHGQTIWHAPADRLSWQLFDPWPIVRALKLPVCYDLRQADLVAGGEGAPITPIADPILYRGKAEMVLNLGGICNYTDFSDRDYIEGGDIAICSILLDGIIQRVRPGQHFDHDGRLARSGAVRQKILDLFDGRIPKNASLDRTLGREDCPKILLDSVIDEIDEGVRAEDVIASAVDFVAQQITHVVASLVPEGVVFAGGGAKNQALLDAIRSHDVDGQRWLLSDDLGIPCEAREAMGFAVLGALSADGVPITLPQVTGAAKPGVAGVWAYPEGPIH